MAASKPISWLYLKNTSLVSLNNNFGTLTLVLGCFPLDIQPYRTMSDYSIPRMTKKKFFVIRHHCPSESKSSPIKSSRPPDVYKYKIYSK